MRASCSSFSAAASATFADFSALVFSALADAALPCAIRRSSDLLFNAIFFYYCQFNILFATQKHLYVLAAFQVLDLNFLVI
jgi:hypothetical protein